MVNNQQRKIIHVIISSESSMKPNTLLFMPILGQLILVEVRSVSVKKPVLLE